MCNSLNDSIGCSVTQRIKQVKQPRGGYIYPKTMEVIQCGEGIEALHSEENIRANLTGLAVDYLTRFMSGTPLEEAFKISFMGALIIGEQKKAEELMNDVKGLDEDFRKHMEPYTAPYIERIQALRDLHDLGFKTWVSIEPYPTPNIFEQDLVEILNKIDFVDKIIFGRLNYNKEVSNYKEYKFFYNDMAFKVIEFCNINNIQYHIKNGTISG